MWCSLQSFRNHYSTVWSIAEQRKTRAVDCSSYKEMLVADRNNCSNNEIDHDLNHSSWTAFTEKFRIFHRTDVDIYIFLTVHVLVCLIGLIGNVLLFGVILRKQFSKVHPYDVFIANLAMGNIALLLSSKTIQSAIYYWNGQWLFSSHMCKLFHYLTVIYSISIMVFQILISTDRLTNLHSTNNRWKFTKCSAIYTSIAMWIGLHLLVIPVILKSEFLTVEFGICAFPVCRYIDYSNPDSRELVVFEITVGFLLPCFGVVVLNILVIMSFIAFKRRRRKQSSRWKVGKKILFSANDIRVIRGILISGTVLILCWLVDIIMYIVDILCDVPDLIATFSRLLGSSYYAIVPFIYGVTFTNFPFRWICNRRS